MAETTCFVDVVVWGRQAETCGEYLSKGSPALIEGRLQLDQWETQQARNGASFVCAPTAYSSSAVRRRKPNMETRQLLRALHHLHKLPRQLLKARLFRLMRRMMTMIYPSNTKIERKTE